MNISKLILTTTVASALSLLAGAPVHAKIVPGEDKDTVTEVKIIDNPGPATLKLIHVPEKYHFETQVLNDGVYNLNGQVADKNNNVTVFNNKISQDWSVKASVDGSQIKTNSGKTATVSGFKINGQNLMGEKADQIIHKSADNKTAGNNTGNISKPITNDGLSISFINEKHDLTAGDVLTGKIHYELYNTPDAK